MASVSIEGQIAVPNWLPLGSVKAQSAEQAKQALEGVLNQQIHKERWKYTPSKKVLALFGTADTANVTARTVVENARMVEGTELISDLALDINRTPEALLALCRGLPLTYLEIAADTKTTVALPQDVYAPLYVRVQRGARLILQESAIQPTRQTRLLWIDIAESAHVEHARASLSTDELWLSTCVNIGAHGHYELHNHSLGGKLHRQDIQISCDAPGAHASITSAAFLPTRTHFDQQVTIEHRAPNTSSQQKYHNIADEGAKSTFNGRIHIHKNSPGVDAHLSNKNLALATTATINAKPELEIYTDDVACSHGATIGQIDSDQLFYCAARGIDPATARKLLCQAFLQEATTGPLASTSQVAFGDMLA